MSSTQCVLLGTPVHDSFCSRSPFVLVYARFFDPSLPGMLSLSPYSSCCIKTTQYRLRLVSSLDDTNNTTQVSPHYRLRDAATVRRTWYRFETTSSIAFFFIHLSRNSYYARFPNYAQLILRRHVVPVTYATTFFVPKCILADARAFIFVSTSKNGGS